MKFSFHFEINRAKNENKTWFDWAMDISVWVILIVGLVAGWIGVSMRHP